MSTPHVAVPYTYEASLPRLVALLESGDDARRAFALAELTRMARLADLADDSSDSTL